MTSFNSDAYVWNKFSYQSITNINGKVIAIIGRLSNIHKIVTERNLAQYKADTDLLTGVLNKSAGIEKMKENILNSKYAENALLMIDIDNFKQINDNYGHIFGDEVIVAISSIFKRFFAPDDVITRFGGDEFVILMQNISKQHTDKKLEKLISVLHEAEIGKASITCSIGAVCFGENADVERLVELADKAMYNVKSSGKATYCIYED